MTQTGRTQNGFSTAGNSLRSLSPKTAAAICLMALMGVLWLRVLTRGRSGPSAAEAASAAEVSVAAQPAAPLRIVPVTLPVVQGRNDVLTRDFFSSANWPGFLQSDKKPQADLSEQQQLEKQRQDFDAMAKTINLDAIIQASGDQPARVCVEGKVLSQGQTLTIKRPSENYELTVSEIGEYQVVLTWNQWSVILKMAQVERAD